MPGEPIQPRIDACLTDADEAVRGTQWDDLRRLCERVLRLGVALKGLAAT